jgi:hypothetical protein
MSEGEVGLSLRLIRAYEPADDRALYKHDAALIRAQALARFLQDAPDYDPVKHDEMIRRLFMMELMR